MLTSYSTGVFQGLGKVAAYEKSSGALMNLGMNMLANHSGFQQWGENAINKGFGHVGNMASKAWNSEGMNKLKNTGVGKKLTGWGKKIGGFVSGLGAAPAAEHAAAASSTHTPEAIAKAKSDFDSGISADGGEKMGSDKMLNAYSIGVYQGFGKCAAGAVPKGATALMPIPGAILPDHIGGNNYGAEPLKLKDPASLDYSNKINEISQYNKISGGKAKPDLDSQNRALTYFSRKDDTREHARKLITQLNSVNAKAHAEKQKATPAATPAATPTTTPTPPPPPTTTPAAPTTTTPPPPPPKPETAPEKPGAAPMMDAVRQTATTPSAPAAPKPPPTPKMNMAMTAAKSMFGGQGGANRPGQVVQPVRQAGTTHDAVGGSSAKTYAMQ